LAPDGSVLDRRRDLYDLAFVVLGLTEAARALGGRDDLIAAAEAQLAWAETHWAHPAGGFREGEVAPAPPRRQNPHMHLFEALLALHEVSGKPENLARASRIAALLRDRLFDASHGVLPEHFDDAWRPLEPRIIEPGHHFEWCWLLDRWRRLGGGDMSDIAERLRQFAETHGVDAVSGAVYEEIFADGRPRTATSRLWPHTERIKANLARFERAGDPAAGAAAAQAFDMLMRYCDTPTPGLWRDRLGVDGRFVEEPAPASSFYHIMLALEAWDRVAHPAN
jgi:mannose-6-phosphate isomerase